jgi:hypothetical protein
MWKGAVYRVSGGRLSMTLTGTYRDSTGTQEQTSIMMTDPLTSGVPLSHSAYAVFNQGSCLGKPALLSLVDVPHATFDVTASWQDSALDTGDQAVTGSCSGSFRAVPIVDSAWNAQLTDIQILLGRTVHTSTPAVYVGSYVNPEQFGSCNQDNIEVLRDAIAGGIDSPFGAHFSLAVRTLKRLGRRFTVAVNVTHSGPVPVQGVEFYGAPGAASFINIGWRGELTFSRVYSCEPHGCIYPPPTE